MIRIGVLALQGDFAKHIQAVNRLGYDAYEVRQKKDLDLVQALILPGGESTTVLKLLISSGLDSAIRKFSVTYPLMGTCAGLILLAKNVNYLPGPPLGLIDISVSRNAYGRQRESFVGQVALSLNGIQKSVDGVFIRAPQITSVGPDVHIIGEYDGNPVIAASKNILVCTFHPELTDDPAIHQYFIDYYIQPQ